VSKSAVRPAVVLLAVIVGAMGWAVVTTVAGHAASGKIFAQELVERTLPKHSEITGLEIAAVTETGCETIAATDPKELGEKCDKDELQPLQTGQPSVDRESDGFDVTVPLHDANGKVIAVVGMDFKLTADQTKESVVKQGQQIAAEMESEVPSKDKLFEPKIRFSGDNFKKESEVRGK
jgi:hypothetical protein